MREFPYGALIFIAILFIAGWYFFGFRKPADDYRHATVVVGGQEFIVDIADTATKQTLGLSGRASLGEREGMLFLFATSSPRTFWMKDMNFPIDLLWLQDDRVIGVEENMQPELEKSVFGLKLYASPGLANRVLEIPAGTVAQLGVKAGDSIGIGTKGPNHVLKSPGEED